MKPITVVAVSTVHHDLLKLSLERTLANTPHVEDVIVFSNKPVINYGTFIPIKDDFSYDDYNYFMFNQLSPFVKTDFILHVHPDGMAVNKQMWTDEFLNYDYIGAPWLDKEVGNGGFSLRSTKLLNALKDSNITLYEESKGNIVNEDIMICRYCRNFLQSKFDIKFAPYDVAKQFSKEMVLENCRNTFGFHGVWYFPEFFHIDDIKIITYNFFTNKNKKNLWEQYLNIVEHHGTYEGFLHLIDTQNEKGLKLWK